MGEGLPCPPCSEQRRRIRSSEGSFPSTIFSRRHSETTLSITPPDMGKRPARASASSGVSHGSLDRQMRARVGSPSIWASVSPEHTDPITREKGDKKSEKLFYYVITDSCYYSTCCVFLLLMSLLFDNCCITIYN